MPFPADMRSSTDIQPAESVLPFRVFYDDADDTIGQQAHSTAIRGRHPNPAQILIGTKSAFPAFR
jgi:hypothetical protein